MDYREVYDINRKKKCKPTFKRWKFNKLFLLVKEHVQSLVGKEYGDNCFTAEGLSKKFAAKIALIHKAIHIIKRDSIPGYYISESNEAPHESTRNSFFYHGEGKSGWAATVYLINKREESKEEA